MSSPVPTSRWGPALEGSGTTAGCDWGGLSSWRGGKAESALQESSPASTMPWVGDRGALGLGELPRPLGTGLKLYATAPSPLCSAPTRGPGEQPPETGQGSPAHQACSGGQASRLCSRPGWAGLGGGNQLFGTEATSAGSLVSAGPVPPSQTGLGVSGRVLPSVRATGLCPRGPPAWGRDHLPGEGTTLPSTDFHWTHDQWMVPESSLGAAGPLRPSASQACSLPAHPTTLLMAWRH